jgi:hypothetical protein
MKIKKIKTEWKDKKLDELMERKKRTRGKEMKALSRDWDILTTLIAHDNNMV